MNVALQVLVGTIAGAVMLVRVGAAICRARIDAQIAARRARHEQDVHKGLPEHSCR
ncbi:hypothetical protein [Amycolatopsis sp. NPDC059657]|uniref:hypothetical protein n=1 Tax=Amycolatopsis sp. NPDC059657 TaxID=3346899 RepID=UPI00367284AD